MLSNAVSSRSPLDLGSLPLVAQGRRRDVYLLAQEDDAEGHATALVLKVPRPGDRLGHWYDLKRVLYKCLPFLERHVLRAEARYIKKLCKSWPESAAPPPIPAFRGFVKTSNGPGSLWQAVLGEDGSLAPTLAELQKQGRIDDALAPLNTFVTICHERNIVAPDIKPANLVYCHDRGTARIVLVDGFGDHRLISLRGLNAAKNHASIDARFAKIAQRAGWHYDPDARCFTAGETA